MNKNESAVRVGIIIQARTGSSRFPKKVVRPFANDLSILEIIIEKLKALALPIVVATTTSQQDDVIQEIALQRDCKVFRGDENDVLSRFVHVSQNNDFDYVIRVCADNPFIDVDLLSVLLKRAKEDGFHQDYYSFELTGKPAILTHLGIFGELVSRHALVDAYQRIDNAFYLEHVTNFIYLNPDDYKIEFIPFPWRSHNLDSIRLTIDTKEDFLISKQVYEDCLKISSSIHFNHVMSVLKNDPGFVQSMEEQISNQPKG